MTIYIALLRGINVGGNRKVAMADLRTMLTDAGCADVTTYIQSGNVVLRDHRSPGELHTAVEACIQAGAGLEVDVMLRTADEWAAVVQANPYDEVEPTSLHVAFLRDPAGPDAAEVLGAAAQGGEEAVVAGREVYMHLPDGIGRAKLPTGLARLGTLVTVRNWRTVTKLLELSRG